MGSLVDLVINDCIRDGILDLDLVDESARIKIFLAYIIQMKEFDVAAIFSSSNLLNLFKKCVSRLYYSAVDTNETIANDYLQNVLIEFYHEYHEEIKSLYTDTVNKESINNQLYGGTE